MPIQDYLSRVHSRGHPLNQKHTVSVFLSILALQWARDSWVHPAVALSVEIAHFMCYGWWCLPANQPQFVPFMFLHVTWFAVMITFKSQRWVSVSLKHKYQPHSENPCKSHTITVVFEDLCRFLKDSFIWPESLIAIYFQSIKENITCFPSCGSVP